MNRTRHLPTLLLVIVAALAAAVYTGCGDDDDGNGGEAEAAETFREGLREELRGLEYNVFLTRQLNFSLPSDEHYYDGPPAPKGSSHYGVFIEVCNRAEEGEARPAATDFRIVDTQGNEFRPVELPEDNAFAYQPKLLAPRECIPAKGSISQLGPTGGALLLFELPIEAAENRPLVLQIRQGGEQINFELDI